MTIAKRLILLLAVPLLGFGIFTRLQLERIEERSRLVAQSCIDALATLGNFSQKQNHYKPTYGHLRLRHNHARPPRCSGKEHSSNQHL
jgi:hypothetical protein